MPDVSIDVGVASNPWLDKDRLSSLDVESRTYWAQLDNDERAAAGMLITEQLMRLIRELDRWLPSSVTADTLGPIRLNVRVAIQPAEFDDAVHAARLQAEREQARRHAELVALERRLRG